MATLLIGCILIVAICLACHSIFRHRDCGDCSKCGRCNRQK